MMHQTQQRGGNEGTGEDRNAKTPCHISSKQNESSFLDRPSTSKKHKTCIYRDRAAKRTFHKEFGEAMGAGSSECPEQAAAKALQMSLGAGSYAQKILENMTWKEGEGLGKSQQGTREPLQPTGNRE
ncbi:uncharacterized protein LOC141653084 [Silene latifolia]|uniref:uncharacterized protein LOC141653084 n=1 Tax=Silene latifolia TaxID=37657 RepID=UPI003D788377